MHIFHAVADILFAMIFVGALVWSCESVGTRVVFAILSWFAIVAVLIDFGLIS